MGTSALIPSRSVLNPFKSWLPKVRGLIPALRKHPPKSNFSNQNPPAPSSPLVKIEGLSRTKRYLYEYGFIDIPPPYTDDFDGNVKKALTEYQRFFHLSITGRRDDSTLQQMSLPRCGVPDMIPTQARLQNLSFPNGKEWLKGKKKITYGFEPESEIPTNVTVVIRDAFRRWSNAMAMNFTEASFSAADIKIGVYSFHLFKDTIYGDLFNRTMYGDVVLALEGPDNVQVGKIRLDGGRYWVLSSVNASFTWPTGVVDLETVMMHHIGHLVGLNHLSAKEAVMYPYILPSQERKVQLSDADIESLQKLNRSSSDCECNAVTAVLIYLSAGLACMVLLI